MIAQSNETPVKPAVVPSTTCGGCDSTFFANQQRAVDEIRRQIAGMSYDPRITATE